MDTNTTTIPDHERAGCTEEEWDALPEETRAALLAEADAEPEDETEPEAPRSLRARLKARRTELVAEQASGERTLELPIPGYNNELWARFTYRPDVWDRFKRIGNAALKSRHPRRELLAAMDTLAYACTDILVSEDAGMSFESFDPEGPCGFNERLAELMEIPIRNPKQGARTVVSGVFNNDLAITAMSNRVSEWLQGEEENVDEDF